jgi:hypothetical protein
MQDCQGPSPKNHPDVMNPTQTDSSHQNTILYTPHHVVARRTVPSFCSPRSLKAHSCLKAIGYPITPSFRRNHSPDQSRITRKQLQQMAEHKVCCRRGH